MKNGLPHAWSTTIVLVVTVALFCAMTALATSEEGENSGEGSCESESLNYPRRDGSLLLYNFASTSSTQDEARKLVETTEIPDDVTTVVVTTEEQTNGRGTSGRKWMGAKGNTFVTICIRQSAWMDTSLPMTILPVRIGIIMAERIDALLQSCRQEQSAAATDTDKNLAAMTTIKWPNDVLVDEKKISGVLIENAKTKLIESSNYWFLIGIGVNVAYAPTVPSSGPNQGRPATSIGVYCPQTLENDNSSHATVRLARQLGEDMAADLSRWLSDHKGSNPNRSAAEKTRILRNWKQWVDWDLQLVLRDTVDHETVTPVDIEPDGRLRVKGSNGQERLIVTDYFL